MSMMEPAAVPVSEGPRTYRFTKYIRLVLPLDGYVFWVRSNLLTESAMINAAAFNSVTFNELAQGTAAGFDAKGSMHYATSLNQDESESYSSNVITFTAEQPIQDLNAIAPGVAYLAEIESGIPGGGLFDPTGQLVRYAFSRRQNFFEQAGIHHYVGTAVYSDMLTQIIDNIGQLSRDLIVSNSLPAWLALNGYESFYGFSNLSLPIYPSFLVPYNLRPPFAAVHVMDTTAIAAAPSVDPSGSHLQLAEDRVRVTMYGVSNDNALSFVDCVNQYSLDLDRFGIMNMPILRDEKKSQAELGIIAQKKAIDYEVSYLQNVMRNLSFRLIKSAFVSFELEAV
jgi:hypothetical protein